MPARRTALRLRFRLQANEAAELFSRVAKFVEHFERTRSGLERANAAFNDAVGSYERMVRPSGERLLKLQGVGPDRQLAPIDPLEVPLRIAPGSGSGAGG